MALEFWNEEQMMFSRLMGCMIVGFFISPLCGADEPAALSKISWGHVSGQVVLEGQLDDPRLQKHFEDLPIWERLTQKQARQGVEARIIHLIPNERLIVDGKSRGVKNALVYLKTRPETIHPDFAKTPLAPVELKYADHQFTPRVFSLQVDQPLIMTVDKNGGDATNFHSKFFRNDNFNLLVAVNGPERKWIPKQSEPIPTMIRSDIEATALACCIIQDHPYVTMTDQQGRFELKNLPVGTHQLVILHETVGYVTRNVIVEIKPNETKRMAPQSITVEQLVK